MKTILTNVFYGKYTPKQRLVYADKVYINRCITRYCVTTLPGGTNTQHGQWI